MISKFTFEFPECSENVVYSFRPGVKWIAKMLPVVNCGSDGKTADPSQDDTIAGVTVVPSEDVVDDWYELGRRSAR